MSDFPSCPCHAPHRYNSSFHLIGRHIFHSGFYLSRLFIPRNYFCLFSLSLFFLFLSFLGSHLSTSFLPSCSFLFSVISCFSPLVTPLLITSVFVLLLFSLRSTYHLPIKDVRSSPQFAPSSPLSIRDVCLAPPLPPHFLPG